MKRPEERREGGVGRGTHAGDEQEGRAGLSGVGSHVCEHGSGLCARKAYGRPIVEEVRCATEGEGVVRGLLPEDFEGFDRLAMGEDVK